MRVWEWGSAPSMRGKVPLSHNQAGLLSRRHGLQVGNHGFGIAAVHAKLWHRSAKAIAVGPDAGRQQLDHFGVAGGWSAANARRIDRPIRIRLRRQIGDGSTLQPSRTVGISAAVARRVALATHGYAFDQILSTSDVSRSTGLLARTLRVIALPTSFGSLIRKQAESDESGKRKENPQGAS